MEFTRVEGRQPVSLRLYTLSTCGWCKKTKALLNELGLGYEYLDLDLLNGDVQAQARQTVTEWNPNCSFPTLIVDGKECVVGFKETIIREWGAR